MATEPSPQRAYRAACPNCGAPVEFRSAASAFAVCSFCRSTLVREGEALRKIGESAELFDDHTPLQLGAAGRYQGAAFTLVGRLQYRYAEGTWNEWHALFDRDGEGDGPEGKSGWLSEDNGRYVMAFDAPLQEAVPPAETLRAGAPLAVAGQRWSVASVAATRLMAAQGELPRPPEVSRGFVVADLRNSRGEVGTLDYTDPARPRWSVGRSVALGELAMTGLADAGDGLAKALKARSIECPNCGAALDIKLSTTQTIVCHQCRSVVDLAGPPGQAVGADLAHYAQQNGSEPLIPLGSTGTLALGSAQPLPWQVVGYVERCEVAGGEGEGDDEGEQAFWREYLLYHRTAGFAFIVDAEDGWSWTVPLTGAPERAGEGAKYQGVVYRKLYDYTGMVTYVLGEFYWQVSRNQRTANTDYQGTGAASAKRLNRESTVGDGTQEVVWSGGETLAADQVLSAFKLAPTQRAALQRDALPTALGGSLLAKIFLWGFIVVVVLLLFRCASGGSRRIDCDDTRATFGDASQEYQNCLASQRSGGGAIVPYGTGGGSFGGYSSGGSHK